MDNKYEQIFQECRKEWEETLGCSPGGCPNNQGWGIQSRTIRLEFPRFDGSDPSGQIYRAEQFFSYHQTLVSQWICVALFHLEGKALQWFWWVDKTRAIDRWKDFTQALTTWFVSNGFNNPTGLLAKFRQTSSVQDYQQQLEILALITRGPARPSWSTVSLRGSEKRLGWECRCSGPHPYLQ